MVQVLPLSVTSHFNMEKSILELLARLSKQNVIESMFSNRKDPLFLFLKIIFRGMCTETV